MSSASENMMGVEFASKDTGEIGGGIYRLDQKSDHYTLFNIL